MQPLIPRPKRWAGRQVAQPDLVTCNKSLTQSGTKTAICQRQIPSPTGQLSRKQSHHIQQRHKLFNVGEPHNTAHGKVAKAEDNEHPPIKMLSHYSSMKPGCMYTSLQQNNQCSTNWIIKSSDHWLAENSPCASLCTIILYCNSFTFLKSSVSQWVKTCFW